MAIKKEIAGWAILMSVALLLTTLDIQAQSVNPHADRIKAALVNRICYNFFWLNENIQTGRNVPVEIAMEGDRFFVWINDLRTIEGARIAGFYQGVVRQNKATVTLVEQYNRQLTPPASGYNIRRKHFESNTVVREILQLPTDCEPSYDAPSKKKDTMLNTIVNTIKLGLIFPMIEGLPGHPVEFTIIVADFNVDYPYTYALVEPTQELYIITLHDFSNWESEEYERQGKYPYRHIDKAMTASLLTKIRKHGIIHKIIGTPTNQDGGNP